MTPAERPEITYTFDVSELVSADLGGGFFVGWPAPPSPEKHLQVVRGSYRALVAVQADRVVGFITAISDGVATAFIPWLEVLPDAQGQGIGRELVRRMQEELVDLYSIDLVCDDDVAPFYDKLGWHRAQAMIQRNPSAL